MIPPAEFQVLNPLAGIESAPGDSGVMQVFDFHMPSDGQGYLGFFDWHYFGYHDWYYEGFGGPVFPYDPYEEPVMC